MVGDHEQDGATEACQDEEQRTTTRRSLERSPLPRGERDACGIGFIADLHGRPSHGVLEDALEALANLEHRGAVAADGKTGDGAGVLCQLPEALFASLLDEQGIDHDPERPLAVGMLFLPRERDAKARCRGIVDDVLDGAALERVTWRTVPTDPDALGEKARQRRPAILQVIVQPSDDADGQALERRLYLARRRIEERAREAGLDTLHIPSFSLRTIVYKGLMVASQLDRFYPDLADERFRTAICVFHQRYSTNTWPSWSRAQPFRTLGHNGEINTLQGNVRWMHAREATLDEARWGEDAEDLVPVIDTDGSDSAMLDNVVELMLRSDRDPLEALLALIPEAHEDRALPEDLEAFYTYHERTMEPWDGPVGLVGTDGELAYAALDRNGLRPLRYRVHEDGRVVVASEIGVVPADPEEIVETGRLGPGRRFAVDTRAGRLLHDPEVKARAAAGAPYPEWARAELAETPDPETPPPGTRIEPVAIDGEDRTMLEQAFDYGAETVGKVLEPMAYDASPPVYSMGDDTPLAVLSARPQPVHRYLKQRFAQVTNPPIDSLRETRVMSLRTYLGPRPRWLSPARPSAPQVRLESPVLTPRTLAWLIDERRHPLDVTHLAARFPAREGSQGLTARLEQLAEAAAAAVDEGADVLVLSDRDLDAEHAPVPMLLAVSAVHQHLVEQGTRMQASIVADTGEVREDHHLACQIGYGADAVHPYLAYAQVEAIAEEGPREEPLTPEDARHRYREGLEKGLLKIMAKMGISTISSYRGAMIFEAIGLDDSVVDRFFPGTPHRVGGADLSTIARDVIALHGQATEPIPELETRGFYRYRQDGEYHAYNPDVFTALHDAVEDEDPEAFERYARAVDERPPCALRDLITLAPQGDPIPLEEVQPAEEIAQRFCTGAMSHGSISQEAHETLAVAMTRLDAKSNTGEGGEDPSRFTPFEDDQAERTHSPWAPGAGDDANSRIKQVASGRFGVTPAYLAAADELEIKMAQGSKPGEGGQIPGHKVTEEIATIRRSTPGVPLISPPPHHDIYSIEDLAQLIHDLKQVNRKARVAVKLVALSGVGTIAAGVAKGRADTIQISGHSGGTGASPLSSIKHAGVPWELGLAETQRKLVENGLRGRVRLRVDGGMKTGRDVVIAAALGAEEFGFGTAALVASGCVMTRQCHLNTCPVGIATQKPELRERFPGEPDRVVAFFLFIAEQVRMLLARLGVRRLEDVIGRLDALEPREVDLPRVDHVDVDALLEPADADAATPRTCQRERNDPPKTGPSLDARLREAAAPALEGTPIEPLAFEIDNRERTVGAQLAGEMAARRLDGGEPATVRARFEGTAGQSFGAFTTEGLHLRLAGDAQDYVGKGMHGGSIEIVPPKAPGRTPGTPAVGNTVLYGATGGRLFVLGSAGERFCVRNSGALAVAEGCGDHGLEYMTGGVAVVLGRPGRNLAAGMSGGLAFVAQPPEAIEDRHNARMTELARVPEDGPESTLLHALVTAHHERTGSERARERLEAWPAALSRFSMVVPEDVDPVELAQSHLEEIEARRPAARPARVTL